MDDVTVNKLVEDLNAAGVELALGEGGALEIRGKRKPPAALLEALKDRKDEVIAFLLGSSPCGPCQGQEADEDHADEDQEADADQIKPEIQDEDHADADQELADYRRAVSWILPRLDDLKRQGWTPKTLFNPRPTDDPFTWGLAWHGLWGRAVDVKLYGKGVVGFLLQGPFGSRIVNVKPLR